MNIKSLGLKDEYDFKETHIPSSRELEDIRNNLTQFVGPTVIALETEDLINGFHYMFHGQIDLRISCSDWGAKERKIKEILRLHSVNDDLEKWRPLEAGRYGGDLGVILCYNNLEFNSRLCLALVEALRTTDKVEIIDQLKRLCPHQWVHYLCNQAGCLNDCQIKFEIDDAFVWLRTYINRNNRIPEVINFARNVLDDAKEKIRLFEQDLG